MMGFVLDGPCPCFDRDEAACFLSAAATPASAHPPPDSGEVTVSCNVQNLKYD